jgi:hypothetical protein
MNICIYLALAAIFLLMSIALVAIISRVNADADNDPPTIVVGPVADEVVGDVVDIKQFYKKWEDR